ncbi:A24 family peptidase [Sphingomonas sp. gentR]|jgi:leader peptidase (prepilin peptidase)/N-methyltransferase|uniref:prepilin peptidase n=1 Tax=unclassified Sphingomonas TaxID=196159 RepID=UPI000972AC50|nr:A24 family peptidase [Sphingomonas sp. LK11]APX65413.1 peptidase A24 [Sphingomonas sp. LK11]
MTFGAASAAWAAIYGVAGAIIGSFVAALVLRWMDERSVLTGRSACDHCGKTLRAWELVPVVSFVALRGRCARCRQPIDPVHWRIEAIAALIGVSAGWVAGPDGWTGALFGWTLLALGALDALAFWLPDRLTVWLAGAGLLTGVLGHAPLLSERVIGGVVGFGALWTIAEGYRRWRGREGMGGGDPKLLGAIGLWLGWRMLPGVLLAACVIGLGFVVMRHLLGQRASGQDMVPLGSLLALAAYPAWVLMIGMAA